MANLPRAIGWGLAVALAVVASGAEAFRNVAVGDAIPGALARDLQGAPSSLVAPGRLALVVFWRPGQALSEEALADAAGLAREGVDVVAVAEPAAAADAVRSRTAGLPVRALLDPGGRAAEAWGVIVLPSTGIIGADGRLRYSLPSRGPSHAALLASHALHARGRIDDAELARRVAGLGEVLGQQAEAAEAAYKRGVALAADGRWADAAAALGEAVRLAPARLDARAQLGYAALELGRAREALEQFDLVLARTPASPAARVGRGIASIRLGAVDEGLRLLEEAVDLNPEPVRGHWELAQAYAARGELGRAIEHYRLAYQKLLQGRH